jgi:hypothetical protein
MLSMRASTAGGPNRRLTRLRPTRGESNGAWLARAGTSSGVLLVGGASLVDVRVRFAQSIVRHDLTPSSWSLAGLLLDDQEVLTVPHDAGPDPSAVPATNAIRSTTVEAFDDPERYPNIAVIAFAASDGGDPLRAAANEVRRQRAIIDLPALVVAWLAYAWGVEDGNPLLAGHGLPSAAFVEAAYAVAGIELTPGLASASSCPEAIWQSARWWGEYYRESARMAATGVAASPGHASPQVPAGVYAVRQPAAAVTLTPEQPGPGDDG